VQSSRNSRIREKAAGLAKSNLVHQGAELAYLFRHDPEFRAVRREHLREVDKRIRVKDDLNSFARVLASICRAIPVLYNFRFPGGK
jgi:hypothetical protein